MQAVLTVGAVLLVLYFVTQVLGVQLPFLSSPPRQDDGGPVTGEQLAETTFVFGKKCVGPMHGA